MYRICVYDTLSQIILLLTAWILAYSTSWPRQRQASQESPAFRRRARHPSPAPVGIEKASNVAVVTI